MRVKPIQLEFLMVLVLGAPSGFASPAKTVAHKPAAASRVAAKTKAAAHAPKLVETKHSSHKATKTVPEPRVAGRAKSRKPEPKVVAHNEKPAAPIRRAEPEPVVEPTSPQETIHVTHDRKQHFSTESPAGQTERRKATSADFLAPSASVTAPVRPAPKESAPALTPTRVTKELVKPEPMPSPILFTKRGRLIVPPALKGSHEILLHQNEMADLDGLDRVRDDEDLDAMREERHLVPIPSIPGLVTDERLPEHRRYTRPWTAQFLNALAKAHYAHFHSALQVNSAVRTVEFQQRLLRTNGNAAPAEGETASPHLTGQAIDLAKHGLSMTEIAWLRGYLLPLVQAGKVDVEEEFQQACFHISVYKKYIPEPAPKREIAAAHHGAVAGIATAIR
jgi:hypothetical protein